MARSKTGQAISEFRRTGDELAALDALRAQAKSNGDLKTWRRAQALRRYIDGQKVTTIQTELGVSRATVNTWLRWYETQGAEGLRTKKAPGAAPRLTTQQRQELMALIDAGPQAAQFSSGLWTGPMIGQLIRERFGVAYHNHHVPRLLHQLGFSVQRPRKRLARADAEAQATWLRVRFPALKKKPVPAEG